MASIIADTHNQEAVLSADYQLYLPILLHIRKPILMQFSPQAAG